VATPAVEGARTVGSFVHLGGARRGPRPSPTGRCLSPDCEEEVGAGGRFCPAHEEVLARVRAELEGDDGNGGLRERFERYSTRGMRDDGARAGEADGR
jgi:hypothetical protein